MRTRLLTVLAAIAVVVGLATPVAALGAAQSAPCASVSVADVDQPEGTGTGVTAFQFTVSVSAPVGCVVDGSVDYHTADGTANGATAPSDYAATSGTLTWTGAASSRTITVAVVPDSVNEANEQFWLRLDNPVGVAITGGGAVGGIDNDDQPVTLSPTTSVDGSPKCWATSGIIDVGGGTCGGIGIHVSGPHPGGVTLHWQTLDAAGPNPGYVPVKDATVTIPANVSRVNIAVTLLPNPNNTQFQFGLRIFQPSIGVLGTATSTVSVTPNG
jgi:Calx-beta domain